MKKLITSSLPYVNNVPHLGNLIGSVLSADVYARFCRLQDYTTLYICATDEYGTATEIKALEMNSTPEEVCNQFRQIHKKVYDFFNIKFDYFGKTSSASHTQVTQDFFLALEKEGYIFEQETKQFYCKQDKIFLADRFIEGICSYCEYTKAKGDQCDQCGKLLDSNSLKAIKCKICKTSPIRKTTKHLYFDLEKLHSALNKFFLASNERGVWSNNALQTTKKLLETKLYARPISRDLKWGVPVPKDGFEGKVFYVWFDAVLGYISASKEYLPKEWKDWWLNKDVQLYQFMAKDNIIFHTILLPAMQLGYKEKAWTTLFHINSCEYLNYEDSKFSKSEKIGVFGDDVIDIGLPADIWRFYLLYNRPETSDSVFDWKKFHQEVHSQLIDNVGNLLNRITSFIQKNFDKKLFVTNKTQRRCQPIYQDWVDLVLKEEDKITNALEKVKLKHAFHKIFILASKGNKLFQLEEPWKKIKEDKERVGYLLYILVALLKDLAIMLGPYVPDLAKKIFKILNIDLLEFSWKKLGEYDFLKNHTINDPQILLEKIDYDQIMEYKETYSQSSSS